MKALSLLFLISLISCSHATNPGIADSFSEKELLRLVNDARKKGCDCGGTYMPAVKPLKPNEKLESAAKTQSDYMARTGRMTHTGNRGSTAGDRISAAGYHWSYYAENVAAGQRTEKEVMNSWLNSPGHCKNIMSAKATEMGAAKTGKYWTLVFARPQ